MLGLVMAASLASAPFLRLNVDVREFGLHGTGTIVVDRLTGHFARRFDVGPAGDSEGYNGSIAWIADAAGSSYVQGNADTRGRLLRWSRLYRTLGSVHTPSQMHMRVGADTETTTFSDVRCVEDAFCVPFAIVVSDQQGTRVIRVRSIDALQHVDAATFAPPSLPNDASVDTPSGVTAIPFSPERFRGHFIPLVVLTARVDGGPPLRFLLDTGGQNILTPAAAKRLGIVISGQSQVGGAGAGTVPYRFAWVDRVQIGAAQMRHQPFMILSLSDILPDIDGMVGAEMLSRFAARFDFKNGMLELARTSPASWSIGTTVSPIAFDKNMPDIAGSTDGFLGRFTLDTGADGALDINAPFAARNDLYALYKAKVNAKLAGVGGGVSAARVTVKKLVLGTAALQNVASTLTYPAAGGVTDDPSVAGNIGELVLRRWNAIVLDYRNLTMSVR